MNPPLTTIAELNGEGFACRITLDPVSRVATFLADADIDADGCPRAYHWDSSQHPLDSLKNAQTLMGAWVGILTDSNGVPLKQGPEDPAPGYYISPTSYEWKDQPKRTQRRYVNGDEVPFIVVPPVLISSVPERVLGCRVEVVNWRNRKRATGIVADVGPRTKCGEVSPAMARLLGIDPDARFGGEDGPHIEYRVFLGQPGVVARKEIELMPMRGWA